ncbi:hypothetical protein AMECASPLE_021976 [Ameca splendens]|uniref:Uncharacterized protein n=1 Tax=Ameca splendens TaxID=208324 RepID=A0ABV1ADA2_9TELE
MAAPAALGRAVRLAPRVSSFNLPAMRYYTGAGGAKPIGARPSGVNLHHTHQSTSPQTVCPPGLLYSARPVCRLSLPASLLPPAPPGVSQLYLFTHAHTRTH